MFLEFQAFDGTCTSCQHLILILYQKRETEIYLSSIFVWALVSYNFPIYFKIFNSCHLCWVKQGRWSIFPGLQLSEYVGGIISFKNKYLIMWRHPEKEIKCFWIGYATNTMKFALLLGDESLEIPVVFISPNENPVSSLTSQDRAKRRGTRSTTIFFRLL